MISRETEILFYEIETEQPCEFMEVEWKFHEDGTSDTDKMQEKQQNLTVSECKIKGQDGYLFCVR